MTKNERIAQLEAEIVDLRRIIARLSTRVAYVELSNEKQGDMYGPIVIPKWDHGDSLPLKVTCINSTPWPFPTNEFPLKGDVGA